MTDRQAKEQNEQPLREVEQPTIPEFEQNTEHPDDHSIQAESVRYPHADDLVE